MANFQPLIGLRKAFFRGAREGLDSETRVKDQTEVGLRFYLIGFLMMVI